MLTISESDRLIISNSDRLIISLDYLYFREEGRGKGKGVVASFRLEPENTGSCSFL
jgi:hypothetical protein